MWREEFQRVIELAVEKEATPAKKKKPDPDSDDDISSLGEGPMPSQNPGPPILPIQPGSGDPTAEDEDEDSEGTVFYPEEDQDDSLLVIDEAEWRGLSDNHKIASNTASFSFVTSMEVVVQDISTLSTTPATYSSLFFRIRS